MRRMQERIEDAYKTLTGFDHDRARFDQIFARRIQTGGFEVEEAKRASLDQHLCEVGIQAEGFQIDAEFELIDRLQGQLFLEGRQARSAMHSV